MHELFSTFQRTFARQWPDIVIPGSPERCLTRVVAEDTAGTLWLVEKLHAAQVSWRDTVGILLHKLVERQTPHVVAPALTANGASVAEHAIAPYQLTPFIHGTPLPRPAYCADAERGEAIGNFIAALQQNGKHLDIPEQSTAPLPQYVQDTMATIRQRHPALHKELLPILSHLNEFFTDYDELPAALAHGDCHPLNIIWNGKRIAGVIDWEFTGKKIVLYDAANCIGCVGFEHPNWLINGLCPALIATLYAQSQEFRASYQYLIPTIVALRFAWLSEWLRKKDTEMQQMELEYMHLLVTNRAEIEAYWKKQLHIP
ncbi:MAG: phosphotransferase [Desulfovibrionales bacterium]|nr:phosphotransferase [Desulfovibrionales bacterium]